MRFASTALHPPASSDAVFVEPGAVPVQDTLLDASEIIASVTKSELDPHIGYMKELGLDFGWGPTAFMQWSLEHVVVYLDTPWWASLVIVTLGVRAVLFSLSVGASDNAARMAVLQPHMVDIRTRVAEAKAKKDMPLMMQTIQEQQQMYAVAGIKMWKNFLPFVQLPLAYGMFRLTRNMAWLPIPGLEIGGLWWFQDLTSIDPYFIMPVVTGLSAFYMFKVGIIEAQKINRVLIYTA